MNLAQCIDGEAVREGRLFVRGGHATTGALTAMFGIPEIPVPAAGRVHKLADTSVIEDQEEREIREAIRRDEIAASVARRAVASKNKDEQARQRVAEIAAKAKAKADAIAAKERERAERLAERKRLADDAAAAAIRKKAQAKAARETILDEARKAKAALKAMKRLKAPTKKVLAQQRREERALKRRAKEQRREATLARRAEAKAKAASFPPRKRPDLSLSECVVEALKQGPMNLRGLHRDIGGNVDSIYVTSCSMRARGEVVAGGVGPERIYWLPKATR